VSNVLKSPVTLPASVSYFAQRSSVPQWHIKADVVDIDAVSFEPAKISYLKPCKEEKTPDPTKLLLSFRVVAFGKFFKQ
jgi:hypothetical protein